MIRRLAWLTAVAAVVGLTSCEDAISADVERSVFLAALPERTLTVQLPANGTVSPAGTQKVKDGQPLELQASASGGYTFYRWEQASGPGMAVFSNDGAPSTQVRLTGGDAVVRAVIDDTVFDVTVASQGGGTTSQTILSGLNKGVTSSTVTASPAANYHFVNWTVTSGAGITFSPSAASAAVTVTANSGDATVQANFALNTYAGTFQTMTGVWPNPFGAKTLEAGVVYPLSALVYETYVFDGWEKVSGTGTATFTNPALASTNLTVTAPWSAGASLSIRAKARKEVLTLSAAGSLASPDQTTYPADFAGAWYDGTNKALYLLGTGVSGSGVIRKFGLASPNSVTTGSNDYRYLSSSGLPSALLGDGTNLYYAGASQIGKLAVAGFGFGSTLSTSALTNVLDLAFDPGSGTLALVRNGVVSLVYKSNFGSYTTSAASYSGWSAYRTAANTYGLYTVFEDNGANALQGVDVVAGATYTGTPQTGTDQDPGWVGKPAFNEDNEYFALPVEDGDSNWMVQIYDGTVPSSVEDGPVSSVAIGASSSGAIRSLSWIGSYLVAAGNNGTEATLWIIDASAVGAPVVRKTQAITGYTDAPYAFYDGTTFWVVVDSASARLKIQGYSVTRS